MPNAHTSLFTELTQSTKTHTARFKPDAVKNKLQSGGISYEAMIDLLREANDANFGIVSTFNKETNTWVRDATKAHPLGQRISHDDPVITSNNALLRCLSRLRAIDYAIDKKYPDGSCQTLRADMKTKFSELSEQVLSIANHATLSADEKNKAIKKAEKTFDTFLVKQLHQANMANGCETAKDAENLLFHYRNLSSVLSPARTLVTITYDKKAGVLARETQYPVTKKSKLQKDKIAEFSDISAEHETAKKNSHTGHNVAIQEADALFADRMLRDDTALPAQTRKSHLVGAKNAFIVKNELIQIDDPAELAQAETLPADPLNVLWLARMASPVFVEKGETVDVLQIHTQENLDQVRDKARELMGKEAEAPLAIHLTLLNTNMSHENQSTIVAHVEEATRRRLNKDDFSYIPTNLPGTFDGVDISPKITHTLGSVGSQPLQKASRADIAATVMLAASASEEQDVISVVNCASGQDRTGTAIELTKEKWLKQRYEKLSLSPANIEKTSAEGGNAAEIATHHVPGSPGMKEDSIANDFWYGGKDSFSPEATKEFYRKSAGTNKKNPVGNVDFLQAANPLALAEYEKNVIAFEKSIKIINNSELQSASQAMLEQVKLIKAGAGEKLTARDLNDLNAVLVLANQSLLHQNDATTLGKDKKKLDRLADKISAQSSPLWQGLGATLTKFIAVVMVVLGLLATLPTFGRSNKQSKALIDTGQDIQAKQGLVSCVATYKEALRAMKSSPETVNTPVNPQGPELK